MPILSWISKSKLGIVGVAMFFMISGASLIYNYNEKINLKEYYKKRFFGIYPMFWIAYSSIFLYIFYECKGFWTDFPIYRLIFSFFAMDGYLSTYFETVYIIGEWFIGCIVLIYLIFPLLRYLMNKFPKIFIIFSTLLYLAVIIFSNFKMPLYRDFIVSVYSFILGMYFIKYIKDCKWWYALIALGLCIIMIIIPATNIKTIVFEYNLVGYCLFVIFCYIGNKISNVYVKNIVNVISKYSYAIFLVHHYIIMKLASRFSNSNIDNYGIICVMIITFAIIAIFSNLLYITNKNVLGLFKNETKENNI